MNPKWPRFAQLKTSSYIYDINKINFTYRSNVKGILDAFVVRPYIRERMLEILHKRGRYKIVQYYTYTISNTAFIKGGIGVYPTPIIASSILWWKEKTSWILPERSSNFFVLLWGYEGTFGLQNILETYLLYALQISDFNSSSSYRKQYAEWKLKLRVNPRIYQWDRFKCFYTFCVGGIYINIPAIATCFGSLKKYKALVYDRI